MERLNILTPRLLIRNFAIEDLQHFLQYRSNPEITKYQGFDVMSVTQAKEFIEKQSVKLFGHPGEWVQYAIENKNAHQLIGDCAIKLDGSDERIAGIGITISNLHQQKGYAKEALLSIVEWLFDVKQIHRIVEITDAENSASISLLKSAGFRQEGHFIENIFFKGKWGSEYQFAMLKANGISGTDHKKSATNNAALLNNINIKLKVSQLLKL